MRMLGHRTQILLDDERHDRLRRRSEESGTSLGALIREAIDIAFPGVPTDRVHAAERLLAADPMAVDDWPALKREIEAGYRSDEATS